MEQFVTPLSLSRTGSLSLPENPIGISGHPQPPHNRVVREKKNYFKVVPVFSQMIDQMAGWQKLAAFWRAQKWPQNFCYSLIF